VCRLASGGALLPLLSACTIAPAEAKRSSGAFSRLRRITRSTALSAFTPNALSGVTSLFMIRPTVASIVDA
jgi:hypothetical protein